MQRPGGDARQGRLVQGGGRAVRHVPDGQPQGAGLRRAGHRGRWVITDINGEKLVVELDCLPAYQPAYQPTQSHLLTDRMPRPPPGRPPAGKDTSVVDSDWFLCPLKILDHEGPFMASFPVENR